LAGGASHDERDTIRSHRVEAEADAPRYRPIQRFWPYVDLPEEPTDEEIAAIDPDLRAELFGPASRAFSITITFPRFEGDDYAAAVALAKASADYEETGRDEAFRHRARFRPREVEGLRDLWMIVGRLHEVDVLIDDRPVPYARTLWLPLCWFLLFR
jgi:hypothetical protein